MLRAGWAGRYSGRSGAGPFVRLPVGSLTFARAVACGSASGTSVERGEEFCSGSGASIEITTSRI